ncbi:MAG: hypothetical protein AB7O97_11940 [Planctomycetota bacterium]
MPATTTDPRKQLLTRSDLHRLEIGAERILEWLAAGSLEQVGELPPVGADAADPVFAVHAAELRRELGALLADIGRPEAALQPTRARSQLVRVLLAERGVVLPSQGDAAGAGDANEGLAPSHDEHDEPVATHDGDGGDDGGAAPEPRDAEPERAIEPTADVDGEGPGPGGDVDLFASHGTEESMDATIDSISGAIEKLVVRSEHASEHALREAIGLDPLGADDERARAGEAGDDDGGDGEHVDDVTAAAEASVDWFGSEARADTELDRGAAGAMDADEDTSDADAVDATPRDEDASRADDDAMEHLEDDEHELAADLEGLLEAFDDEQDEIELIHDTEPPDADDMTSLLSDDDESAETIEVLEAGPVRYTDDGRELPNGAADDDDADPQDVVAEETPDDRLDDDMTTEGEDRARTALDETEPLATGDREDPSAEGATIDPTAATDADARDPTHDTATDDGAFADTTTGGDMLDSGLELESQDTTEQDAPSDEEPPTDDTPTDDAAFADRPAGGEAFDSGIDLAPAAIEQDAPSDDGAPTGDEATLATTATGDSDQDPVDAQDPCDAWAADDDSLADEVLAALDPEDAGETDAPTVDSARDDVAAAGPMDGLDAGVDDPVTTNEDTAAAAERAEAEAALDVLFGAEEETTDADRDDAAHTLSGQDETDDAVADDEAAPEAPMAAATPSFDETVLDAALAEHELAMASTDAATATTADQPVPEEPFAAELAAADDAVSSASAAARAPTATPDLGPVHESLQQIHLALMALAERPLPTLDTAPLTAAIERGFVDVGGSLRDTTATDALGERLDRVSAALTAGSAAIAAAIEQRPASTATATPAAIAPTAAAPRRGAATLIAVAMMIGGWVGALWLHTGDPRTAMIALFAANLLGCLALLFRRA